MSSIFKKSIELNMKIEKFMDIISNSLILFEQMLKYYLSKNMEAFQETLERICILESEADDLETEIKVTLYKFMLLPDTRADVLSLVKSLDEIIDAVESITKDINIQKPNFPESLHENILLMMENSTKTAETLLCATRAFFSEVHLVSSHINKVKFYEHETDILEDKINMSIFNDGLGKELAGKIQLKYFVSKIAGVADEAERIGDKLTIFTIKREI